MTMEDLEAIFKAADEMTGWYGEVARFLVHFYPFTGVRASELRRAGVKDIDLRTWTFTVQHPKGELRYARKRTTVILDEKLVEKAKDITGLRTTRAVVDHALRELLRHRRQRTILKLRGKVDWRGDLAAMRRGRDFS